MTFRCTRRGDGAGTGAAVRRPAGGAMLAAIGVRARRPTASAVGHRGFLPQMLPIASHWPVGLLRVAGCG
ncbi:MAG: hypothetical protein ACRDTH_12780 [Pseudonocardiaceae bacterium]